MIIPVTEAVDMLYHGRSNVCTAAKAADVEPELLKRLLLEKVRTKPEMAPLQLTLPFI
tara:strand:- start:287 stop:460 length:174 start_codon:yes stop_codon:yes gene_type:complete